MKKLLVYTLLLLAPFALISQDHYVGLSIGPSFPQGDFAKTDLADSTSGWAKTGVAVNFNYAYRITHNFGITGIINYSSNAFNTSSYKSALEEAHPDTTFSVISQSNWNGGGIFFGPYLTFPIGDAFSWDVRGLFGFYGATSPRLTINPRTDDGNTDLGDYIRQRASAFSYAFMVGTGFKYQFSKYYLLVFGDYVTSPLKFQNGSGWDFDDEPFSTQFTQDVSYLSITVGLGYFF